MARTKPGYRQWSGWIQRTTMERIEALAARNCRAVADEVDHALERHLAAPPEVTVLVTAPPLPAAKVEIPDKPPGKRRGRPRKNS